MRGTTVVWGDYGMRLKDHHRRLSAMHLKNAEEAIKKKLRGMKYRLYMRVACNIPVYTKGNEVRMGTGKGSHDFWAARVPVSRIIFELKGVVHEQIVKEAFRLAGDKMPGWFFPPFFFFFLSPLCVVVFTDGSRDLRVRQKGRLSSDGRNKIDPGGCGEDGGEEVQVYA